MFATPPPPGGLPPNLADHKGLVSQQAHYAAMVHQHQLQSGQIPQQPTGQQQQQQQQQEPQKSSQMIHQQQMQLARAGGPAYPPGAVKLQDVESSMQAQEQLQRNHAEQHRAAANLQQEQHAARNN